LSLTVKNGSFTADARMEADAGAQTRQVMTGRLVGDWVLSVAGEPFVTLGGTEILFESGRGLNLRLDPRRIRLHGVLEVLSDIMSGLQSQSGSGLTVSVLQDAGLPVGVEARLDLPLPDVSLGVFALSGVRFRANLGLENRFVAGGSDFALRVGFGFGRAARPRSR
jgi:hypothetical protein